MAWWNPFSWGSSPSTVPAPVPMAQAEPAPAQQAYGGKKGKTRRSKKGGRRHRTGRSKRT